MKKTPKILTSQLLISTLFFLIPIENSYKRWNRYRVTQIKTGIRKVRNFISFMKNISSKHIKTILSTKLLKSIKLSSLNTKSKDTKLSR